MQAFPCPMGPDFPECDRGMTLRDFQATHFAAAWVQALAIRSQEAGFSDATAAREAVRLGALMAQEYFDLRQSTPS